MDTPDQYTETVRPKRAPHEFEIFTKTATLGEVVTLQAFADEAGISVQRLRAAAKAGHIQPAARFGKVDVFTRKKVKSGLIDFETAKLREKLGGL